MKVGKPWIAGGVAATAVGATPTGAACWDRDGIVIRGEGHDLFYCD